MRHWTLGGKCLLLLAVLFSGHLALRAQEGPPEEPQPAEEPIRVDVNLVTLRFSVKDSVGGFLNRLGKDDFTILENGQPQEIIFFEPPTDQSGRSRPLWLAFLLDVSGSTFATRAEEILAAQSFFENVYSFTRVGIFGFTNELLTFQEFTSDRGVALEAFGAARTHLGKTAIYSSVDRLLRLMDAQAGSQDRKAVIVISDGMDDEYRSVSSSVDLAKERNTSIYTIWVPSASQLYIGPSSSGKSSKDQNAPQKEAAFARLSSETGGRHFGGFEAILDFDEVLAEINQELFGNLYSVGYATEYPHLSRAQRSIQIRAKPNNAFVHGVFEKVPERIDAKKRYIEALFTQNALDQLPSYPNAFREIGADMDILKPRERASEPSLPFRLKISSFSLPRERDGSVRTQFGVIGILTDSSGEEVVRLREIFRASLEEGEIKDGRGIIYTNRLFAPPGQYYFKLALLEIPSWRMTVLERTVRIQ